MQRISQHRLRIFGFEPDRGGGRLLVRVLRSRPGVTAARFDEPRQVVCVELLSEVVALEEIVAAIERTGFRATESREPCPCCRTGKRRRT